LNQVKGKEVSAVFRVSKPGEKIVSTIRALGEGSSSLPNVCNRDIFIIEMEITRTMDL